MTPTEIKRIRSKLKIDEELFAELFGLSSPSVLVDIENSSVKPAGIIITMLGLLDSLPEKDADTLIEGMLAQARKNSL